MRLGSKKMEWNGRKSFMDKVKFLYWWSWREEASKMEMHYGRYAGDYSSAPREKRVVV